MQLLFADALPGATIAELESRGHDCVVEPALGGERPRRPHRAAFDVLVVRSTKVEAPSSRTPTGWPWSSAPVPGTNTIDTTAAAARGVLVANVPGRNSAAVAELTMGLLLAVDRRIPDNVVDLRAGRWEKKSYGKAAGLLGTTMGIVGLGSIGLCVAERAVAFGIKVQALEKPREAYVETRAPTSSGITICATLEELLATSDIVSLHVPVAPETKHLVDDDVPQPPAARRDPAEHLARRRHRRGGPAGGARRGRGAGGPRRLRRRTRQRHGRLELARSPSTPAWSAPTTSAPRPSRRSSRPPPAWSRSSTRSSRARPATASTSHRAGSGR